MQLGPHEMRRLRGSAVAMVFQEPMSSLDPVFTVGAQMVEAIRHHGPVTRTEAFAKAIGLLDALDISDPERWMSAYPHHLSGGMAQRVGLAIALAGEPKLLIADEPTTALDVTLQAQALKRIAGLKSEFHLSVLFITHDLAVINEIADRVAVMYCGRIVEIGPTAQILGTPAHPYTHGLLRSLPGFVTGKERIPTIAGSVADLLTLPAGCKFEPRCPNRIEVCSGREPDFEWRTRDHGFRCYNPTAL